MEKAWSVEDIVGSLTKMGSMGGSMSRFPRTDSEQAFQDFLKRIPSSNSLAAFNSANSGSQADLAAQAAQLHSLQAGIAAAASSTPPDASGTSGILGVPRVASLDFFRQLLPVNQLNVSGAKPPTSGPQGDNAHEEDGNHHGGGNSMRSNGHKMEPSAGSAFSPPPPNFTSELPPIPGVGTGLVPAAPQVSEPVRVLPLRATSPARGAANGGVSGVLSGATGGRGPLPPMPGAAPQTEREKELAAKAELRRARRMLSNRESARRSRKRKQEHLGELQGQIGALQEAKEEVDDELEAALAQIKRKDTEIAQLRAQNEQLREQLSAEGPPVAMQRGGGKAHGPSSPRAADKPPLAAGPAKGKAAAKEAKRKAAADA